MFVYRELAGCLDAYATQQYDVDDDFDPDKKLVLKKTSYRQMYQRFHEFCQIYASEMWGL
jgi:hypothetical protein